MLNPDMPTQELRLHMGELTNDEVRVARAAIRWANTQIPKSIKTDSSKSAAALQVKLREAEAEIKRLRERLEIGYV